jgi:hypothetical protein
METKDTKEVQEEESDTQSDTSGPIHPRRTTRSIPRPG